MSGKLTKDGYIKSTPEEIRDQLVEKIKLRIPDFELYPADLISDLINTAIEDLAQYEDMTETMLNAIAPGYANDDIFKKFAESVGLSSNKKFNSSVILTFTGPIATFIPKGTSCSGGGYTVTTTKDVIISSTMSKTVLAETEEVVTIPANSIYSIDNLSAIGLTVTNEVEGTSGIEQETLEQLKFRAQARFRSPRKGGIDYTQSVLTTNLKVDPRLIKFRVIENYPYTNESGYTSYMRAIDSVVGGGSDEDVALALFQGFVETQKLVSVPSDNDSTRSVNVNVNYYENYIPVSFTRPKALNLSIILVINFSDIITTPTSIKGATEDSITNYINNLKLGSPISKLTLNSIILPTLTSKDIQTNTITFMDYNINIDGRPSSITGSEGFISEIKWDTYTILSDYSVVIGNSVQG